MYGLLHSGQLRCEKGRKRRNLLWRVISFPNRKPITIPRYTVSYPSKLSESFGSFVQLFNGRSKGNDYPWEGKENPSDVLPCGKTDYYKWQSDGFGMKVFCVQASDPKNNLAATPGHYIVQSSRKGWEWKRVDERVEHLTIDYNTISCP